MSDQRHVVWFSCGAASAVLARMVTRDTLHGQVDVVYCDVLEDEHPDNRRFMNDVAEWIGQDITIIRSDKYRSVDDVFADRRYMAGIAGAPCTVEMKKVPRFAYQRADDIHYFGFTADERHRIDRFAENNPELETRWPLLYGNVTKDDCYRILEQAGIDLPAMYQFGYTNNNCMGCVKATSATYWNMIRRDFPDVFDKRARQSREYGARLTRMNGERIFLDELPADYLPAEPPEDISCGPDCSTTQLSLIAELEGDEA